ncbi:hypothetical protein AXG93_93s1230 [Marchantia polymorpha subsp. ruderalis]|uniref:Uncharacterized protein n=1 Tax=Marchantia polymorpha subsp. ruderalis TaxID=1480154 RepID=A0A176WT33_MARPO|nr:hypothetical protein AXG93_93s1230 [Marchantia polymorpha subsp. ruderalis]
MISSGITLDADLNRAPEMEGQSRGFSRSWEKTRIWFEPGASNMHGAKSFNVVFTKLVENAYLVSQASSMHGAKSFNVVFTKLVENAYLVSQASSMHGAKSFNVVFTKLVENAYLVSQASSMHGAKVGLRRDVVSKLTVSV